MSTENLTDRRVIVSADRDTVFAAVARRIVEKLAVLSVERPLVHVSITGGRAGVSVLSAISGHPGVELVDWSRVHFWWSDERYVPEASPDRNALQARDALLTRLSIPSKNVHEVLASDRSESAEAAAEAYSAELAGFASSDDPTAGAWPSFDICLLGVGPDAHIASLFPDRPEIGVTDRAAVAVYDSPKAPPVRVTLTRPVINASQRVWLVLTGSEKAAALGLALAGASYMSVPAAGAKGRHRTLFFVDADAAAEVPAELIDPD
ncbi:MULTISPECIES: 6-phosphogluconolactonase [unclassified Microbacterium]|uniref:6-phosphogluconolactonase n=1 Tax=unclassified Microbacterium TaxID=2609290 RepID=UPI000C2C4493|nr:MULTISPECIES: 6-phosphogluconolactonase [unclassified Microbacterium]